MISTLQEDGRIKDGQTLALYTDSRSSVQRLERCRRHHEKTLNNVQTLLQKVTEITEDGIKNLVIQWVPAHCGTVRWGNFAMPSNFATFGLWLTTPLGYICPIKLSLIIKRQKGWGKVISHQIVSKGYPGNNRCHGNTKKRSFF